MNYWGPICVLACLMALTFYYRHRLFGNDDVVYTRRWLVGWLTKGIIVPAIVFILMNVGSSPLLPAVKQMPHPDAEADAKVMARMARIAANNNLPPPAPPPPPTAWERFGKSFVYVATQTGATLVALSSMWTALTFGWFVVAAGRRVEDKSAFVNACAGWGLLLLPVVAFIVYVYGLPGVGIALLAWFCPLTHYASVLLEKPASIPVYGGAISKLKLGKYREAEKAILGELEKCETDFDGWMMLAELYATRFGDLGEAERTILELCGDPKTTLPQISIALHKLADLHLSQRGDAVAARRVLDEISRRMPGTHLARMASLRLAQIPASNAALEKKQQRGHSVKLPVHREDNFGTGDTGTPRVSESEATRQAEQRVERLNKDPNDVRAREELAGLLAEQLQQFAPAIEQLDLLVNMAGHPGTRVAGWLALMAEWQVRAGNLQAARELLLRIIHEHRETQHAFAAQRRLNLIDMEARMQKSARPPASGPLAANETG